MKINQGIAALNQNISSWETMWRGRRKPAREQGRGFGALVCFDLAALCALLISMDTPVLAQCAMCQTTANQANQAATFSGSLNLGILVLLVPPVVIFCAIFAAAFKNQKQQTGRWPEDESAVHSLEPTSVARE